MSGDLRRFFVSPGSVRARNVTLGPDLAHRLGRVLRLKRGDRVILSEGGRREYEAQITGISGQAATAVVVAERDAPPEPSVRLSLCQSLIRPNRFDLVLEKGTEIGVSCFVPITTGRTQPHGNGETSAARSDRWNRIVVEAAEQCGRGRLPEVTTPITLEDALRSAPGLKLLPYEGERSLTLTRYLRDLSPPPREVSVFIGPEGGFEDEEVSLARERGAVTVSLGRRVMRSETAAIVAVALVLDSLDPLD